MDYFIIFIATASGLYFHWWLVVRMRRWADRDLALSLAEGDAAKREYMLARLEEAKQQKVPRKDRKSTRLNSSHVKISYAVFCLEKKKITIGLRGMQQADR